MERLAEGDFRQPYGKAVVVVFYDFYLGKKSWSMV